MDWFDLVKHMLYAFIYVVGSVFISFLLFKRICEDLINWMWAIIAGHFKINGCEVKINAFRTHFTSLISDALV